MNGPQGHRETEAQSNLMLETPSHRGRRSRPFDSVLQQSRIEVDEQTEALIGRFEQQHADVLLIGTEAVCEALRPVAETLGAVGAEMGQARSQGVAAAHALAYGRHREAAMEAQAALLIAMRADVAYR